MKTIIRLFLLVFSVALSLSAGVAQADDYFVADFESGTEPPVLTDMPDWSLTPVFADNYGPKNFFYVTNSTSHTGNYSLRLSLGGKNDFCNVCGTTKIDHKDGLDGVDYFVADTGENLAFRNLNDGPGAKRGAVIFNQDAGYSKWRVKEVANENAVNDKLILEKISSGINGEPDVFNSGDAVSIARTCGVDGKIGLKQGLPDINRRSDCNGVVTWFGGIEQGDQQDGASIFRRQYLKQEVAELGLQKVHYFRPNRDGTKGSVRGEILLVALHEPAVDLPHPYPQFGLKSIGGPAIFRPKSGLPDNTMFERGKWYYTEVEFKASTFDTTANEYNADGAYRVWFAESGTTDINTPPILEVTGLTMPALSGGNGTHMSLWGNNPHQTSTVGNWYIDDIVISDTRVGPIPNPVSTAGNLGPPAAP